MITILVHLAAVAATLAATACFYLGAPRQQWRAVPWPAGPSRLAGSLLLAVAWGLWAAETRVSTGFFMVLTMAMTSFAVVPAAAALIQDARRGQP